MATAESLARSIMETVKTLDAVDLLMYSPDVPPDYTSTGYTATISAVPVIGKLGIKKITVDVSHHGDPVLNLEGYWSSR